MKWLPAKEDGFTLVELMVASALLVIAGIMAMELMGMVRTASEKQLRNSGHLSAHLELVKNVTSGTTGIKRFEADRELFYQTSLKDGFTKVKPIDPGFDIDKYPGIEGKITSHKIQKKIGDTRVEYYSICLPIHEAVNKKFTDITSLRSHNLIPFIQVTDSGNRINCCNRRTPNCGENILTEKSRYVIQTFRYDSRTEGITALISQGSYGILSGMGFFVFQDPNNEKILRARAISFFNECLSQEVLWKKRAKNCSSALRIKHDEIVREFDYAMEGINQLGGGLKF